MNNVTIYTDGSWKNHLHSGGWSCLMTDGVYWQLLSGTDRYTTISRMELTAVLMALSYIVVPSRVIVVSDSQYVVKCINEWIDVWKVRGWKKSDRKPVENQDLLMEIGRYMTIHSVCAKWIKSHTKRKGPDYLGNNCVDWFAQYGASIESRNM